MGDEGYSYLPRLEHAFYQGDAVVHWTNTFFDHDQGWLTESFHAQFRELMLHAAAREGLFCPAYCCMPDHFHLLWMGLRPDSDQLNGMGFLRSHLAPVLAPHRLQPQPHDRVFRDEDRKRNAFAKAAFYILNNPVRRQLVEKPEDWPYCGSVIPGYPTLHSLQPDFWEKFWILYFSARHPKAGHRVLPSIS